MKKTRTRISLQSDAAQLVFDLGGGGIVGFCLSDAKHPAHGLTPLAWNNPGQNDLEPREMAHFVVLDRWCNATSTEAANGMPFNGEAVHTQWQVVEAPTTRDGLARAVVAVELAMAGLMLERTMELRGTVLHVQDRITNKNLLGRPFNMIQHATIGPPFLDEGVLVDTKVKQGFTQEFELRTPVVEEPIITWPKYTYNGHDVDMRRLSDYAGPLVTSFIFGDDQKIGWATASNPAKQLMIGYLWQTQDFPWLNLWRHVVDGRPMARGMEFGTTGLLQPFPVLARKRQIFNRQLSEWIDAGQTVTKQFTAFLAHIPADFQGVADVQTTAGNIQIVEHGSAKARTITIDQPAGLEGR